MEEIDKNGGQAEYIICPVDQEAAVQKAVDRILLSGIPDILVNNAGISHIGNAETTSAEDFEKLFAVNVKGLFPSCENLHSAYEGPGWCHSQYGIHRRARRPHQ